MIGIFSLNEDKTVGKQNGLGYASTNLVPADFYETTEDRTRRLNRESKRKCRYARMALIKGEAYTREKIAKNSKKWLV